jgi:hypothetical protein
MLSARRQFLDVFLGALGAAEIVECLERETEVRGTIRFAEDSEVIDLTGDEGEMQDFVWRVREEDAPSLLAYRIADVMNRYQLVEIDKLRVSREALLAFLRNEFPEPAVEEGEFAIALGELMAIKVEMVEDGDDTGDVFSLRE